MITLPDRFRGRLSLTVAVQLFVVFVCGAVLIAEITESLHSRQLELDDSRTDAVNLSRSIGRHLDDCFDIAEVLLTGVVSRVDRQPITAQMLKELHAMMQRQEVSAPVIDGINLYDEHGYWLANSFSSVPTVYSVADRPIFRYHQNHDDLGTHVGAVTLSRATGKSVVVVSRRYNKPDGSFGGMVSVSISMDYFQHYMKGFDIGRLGAMYIASSVDRMVLARVPYVAEVVGRSFPAGAIWQHIDKAPEGVWTAPSQIDGRKRINSYHASEKYPLIVNIAIAEDDALRSWSIDARNQFIRSILLCLLIIMLGQALSRHFRRLQETERDLRRREAALRALFERTTDYLIVHDVADDGQFPIARLNSAAAGRLGLSETDAIGRSLRDFPDLHPIEDYEACLRRCVAQREPIRISSTLKHDDQSSYWEIAFTPLFEDGGRIDRVLVTSRDITHLKRQEAEVVEANRLLLLAEQIGHFGHWHLSLPSHRLTWSDEMFRIFDLDPATVTPSFPLAWSRYHPDDLPQVRDALDGAVKHGTNYEVSMRVIQPDGGIRWVSSRAICEHDESGKVRAVFGVFLDLTESKEREQAMRQAKETAEAMTRAKSEFLSTMSHELRTPLTGVLGMIDLLKAQPSVAEANILLDTLKLSAESLQSILGDILDFSKIESGRLVLEQIDMRVADVVENVVGLFSAVATKRGLTLSWSGDLMACKRVVRGDPTRLRQVMSNLVSNAIKFTSEGNVALKVAAPNPGGTLWRFEISDTGIGVDPTTQAHLFDAFSQADASITRRYGGTGLGLAISKRIVEAMGGQIGVISIMGQGSVFWFEVRLQPVDAMAAAPAEPLADPMRPTEFVLKVLVAEDNSVNQMLITTMLRTMGHESVCVGDGRQAVAAVQAGDHDLVLMDMQMPEMDGASATRAIRALGGAFDRLPIIGLTADTLPEHVAGYMEAGLSGFLGKPINLQQLRAVLDKAVASLPETRRRSPSIPATPVPGAVRPASEAADSLPATVSEERRTFDRRRLDDLRGSIGLPTTLKLLNSFAQDMGKRIVELRSAAQADDKATLAAIAHAISGASANLGASRLANAASSLGKALRNGENYVDWIDSIELAAETTEVAVHQMAEGEI